MTGRPQISGDTVLNVHSRSKLEENMTKNAPELCPPCGTPPNKKCNRNCVIYMLYILESPFCGLNEEVFFIQKSHYVSRYWDLNITHYLSALFG